jgi:hypothetical protein
VHFLVSQENVEKSQPKSKHMEWNYNSQPEINKAETKSNQIIYIPAFSPPFSLGSLTWGLEIRLE